MIFVCRYFVDISFESARERIRENGGVYCGELPARWFRVELIDECFRSALELLRRRCGRNDFFLSLSCPRLHGRSDEKGQ